MQVSYCRDAIRKEIEQVKQDIKKLNRSRDSDNDDEPKKKKQKTSFVEVERQKYLSSGKAIVAKRQKKSEEDVSDTILLAVSVFQI